MNKIIFNLMILLLGVPCGLLRASAGSTTSENPIIQANEQRITQFIDSAVNGGVESELLKACAYGTIEQVRDLFKNSAISAPCTLRTNDPLDISIPNLSLIWTLGAEKMVNSVDRPDPNKLVCQIYPLYFAVFAGNLLVVKEFIDRDFLATHPEVMTWACIFGRPAVLEHLLSLGVKPTWKILLAPVLGWNGLALLSYTHEPISFTEQCLESSGFFHCLELLTQEGITFESTEGFDPLIFFYLRRDTEAWLKKVLQLGCNMKACNSEGDAPLHVAVADDSSLKPDPITLLVSFGADPNQPNALGETPLHVAARTCKLAAIKRLLTIGSDPLRVTKTEYTPLGYLLTRASDYSIIDTLEGLASFLEGGADFTVAQRKNRFERNEWLPIMAGYTEAPQNSPLSDHIKELQLRGLAALCAASSVLFLPTHEEVEHAGKNLLHLIWCLKQKASDCSSFKTPYLQRDFIMNSPLRDDLIKLYLVRLRNVNPLGVHMFAGIEKQVALYLYEKIYALYFSDNPELPSRLQTTLTKDEFKEFVMSHVQEALDRRTKALRDRDRKKISVATSSTSS